MMQELINRIKERIDSNETWFVRNPRAGIPFRDYTSYTVLMRWQNGSTMHWVGLAPSINTALIYARRSAWRTGGKVFSVSTYPLTKRYEIYTDELWAKEATCLTNS